VLEVSRKDFEHSIERKVDIILPFDAKAASQAAKLGQPLAKVTKSAKLTQPFAELLSQTVDHASAEGGGDQAAPKGGNSLLGKFNFKSFSKKAKEPSSQPA
jgi:pilus assembly protein CpaE